MQLVFTSIFQGTGCLVGNSNIIVDGGILQSHCVFSINPLCNHVAALELHEYAVRKTWKFVASRERKTDATLQCRQPGSTGAIGRDEIVLGVLGDPLDRKNGTFHLSVMRGILPLRKKSSKLFSHYFGSGQSKATDVKTK